MNNEEYINKAVEPLLKMYTKIENDLLVMIAEHFKINDEFLNSDYWRIKKLEEMGLFNEEVIEYLAQYSDVTKEEILKALEDIGYHVFDIQKLERAFKNGSLKINPNTLLENYTIQNIINNAYDEVSNRFIELSRKIQDSTREAYLDIVEQGYLKTSMGTHSYQEAIRESINELGNKGIRTLTYRTVDENDNVVGIRSYDIESTVRRDILTATRQLSDNINQSVVEELECEYIYLSEHIRCRPTHFDWQGTIIKYDDLIDVTRYGEVDGLAGINCAHYFEAYFGDARGDELKSITKEEAIRQYNLSQQQRYLERGIRKWKRKVEMFKANGDVEAFNKSKSKVKEWQSRLSNFTKENNLRRDYTREYVAQSKINNLIPYNDVTDEWLNNAKPNTGKVINRNYYIDTNGNKYEIDNKNVVFDPSPDEIELANWVNKTFGGNIYINPKVNYPLGIETSDYLWKNQRWDKKSIDKNATSLTRAVDNALKKHKGQTDYIFLDISNSVISERTLIKQTKKIFSTKGREWIKGIMIIKNYEIKAIYMRK